MATRKFVSQAGGFCGFLKKRIQYLAADEGADAAEMGELQLV